MDNPLFNRQCELEQEMQKNGAKRFWEMVQKAVEHGEESTTSYGVRLAQNSVIPLEEAIKTYFAEVEGNTAGGPKPVIVRLLEDADPRVTAFIAVKVVLDSITKQKGFPTTAASIGAALEDEARFRQFSGEKKAYWETIIKRVESSTKNKPHKRKVLIHAMNKASESQPELLWNVWPDTEKFHVGARLLDLLMKSTKLITLETRTEKKKGKPISKTFVKATEELMAWIEGQSCTTALLFPVFLPTIIPPKPWTQPFDGGYHTKAVRQQAMVKTHQQNYLEELVHQRDEMPVVYEAVNAIQNTPWKINEAVYHMAKQIWEEGMDLGVTPDRNEILLPVKPIDIDTNEDSREVWKRAASKVHEANAKNQSKRLQFVQMLSLADKFLNEAAIYFPQQLDFRGRMYAIPSSLNPQGCDAAKALLCFAEGKVVGEAGLRWLKIHAANCFGEDKCSMDERVEWANTNLKRIVECSADPLAERWWTEADKPWQFLAACMEIHAVIINPDHKSCLPVSVDGSCNGLQHFSAMLRDSIGGRAVNLVPQTRPNDIYERVAEVSRAKVMKDSAEGNEAATRWLAFGFDRKATKRPVMTLPYGAKEYSAKKYLRDYIEDSGKTRLWVKEKDKEQLDDYKMSGYLAKQVWSSIGEVVVAARSAMDWLQKVARVAAKAELPVNWKTPVGFPVMQAYYDMQEYRVKTMLGDQVEVKVTLLEETNKLHYRKQASGISPNFVHSMDAAALMLSVHECRKEGITNFAMVHDSYGTLAADMDTMVVCLREAFVELYQHDVLEEFRQSILAGLSEKAAAKVPPCPTKGDLDLNAVKQSVYFFA